MEIRTIFSKQKTKPCVKSKSCVKKSCLSGRMHPAQLHALTSNTDSCLWLRNMEARSGKAVNKSMVTAQSVLGKSTGKDTVLIRDRNKLCNQKSK